MMFAILWIEEKKYYTSEAKMHWTSDINFATRFKTLETATNFAKNGLSDKIHVLEYVDISIKNSPLVEGEDEIVSTPDMTKEEAEIAYEELRKTAEAFGKAAEKMPSIMKYYKGIQNDQQKLQEDLLHKFEFTSSSNIMFVKLGRMLKKCRLERREAKDRIDYMVAIGNCKPKDLLKSHEWHDKTIANRAYSPRIAPELFD